MEVQKTEPSVVDMFSNYGGALSPSVFKEADSAAEKQRSVYKVTIEKSNSAESLAEIAVTDQIANLPALSSTPPRSPAMQDLKIVKRKSTGKSTALSAIEISDLKEILEKTERVQKLL